MVVSPSLITLGDGEPMQQPRLDGVRRWCAKCLVYKISMVDELFIPMYTVGRKNRLLL